MIKGPEGKPLEPLPTIMVNVPAAHPPSLCRLR